MKVYTIYFEVFGKKMKHSLLANSELDAKQKIAEKIIFHKLEVEDKEFDLMDEILNIAGYNRDGSKKVY